MNLLSLEDFSKLIFNIYLPNRSNQFRIDLSRKIDSLGAVRHIANEIRNALSKLIKELYLLLIMKRSLVVMIYPQF